MSGVRRVGPVEEHVRRAADRRRQGKNQGDFVGRHETLDRLTDASGARTFRVFPIGQMVSFSKPEAQVTNAR